MNYKPVNEGICKTAYPKAILQNPIDLSMLLRLLRFIDLYVAIIVYI